MRYENRAYGTRQEILDHVKNSGLTPGRSERRMREAARAVVLLEEGEDYVEFAGTLYVVENDATDNHATDNDVTDNTG